MEAKLIKGKHSGEYLLNMEGVGYITTYESILSYKLSLKNCQAIERGYDLDELVDNEVKGVPKGDERAQRYYGFINGFQKALDLNNTKLYTLEDMMNCWNKALTFQDHKETLGEYIQSLKQTEWDVEIEMVPALSNNGNVYYGDIPKLDENGCLILKLKSK